MVRRFRIDLPNVGVFEQLGFSIMGLDDYQKGSLKASMRRFKAHFGLEPRVVAIVWKELAESGWLRFAGVRLAKPEHLLWCLLFLNNYNVEEIHSSRVGCCETTFRKWAWFYATGIANLDRKFVSGNVPSLTNSND